MSKGLGQKIAIKFTDDITGNVTGNEAAFSVGGFEYQYVDGPLIEKSYAIEEVNRYPVPIQWQIEVPLELGSNTVPGGSENVTSLGVPVSHSEFSVSYADELAFNGSIDANGWYASGTVGRWIGLDFGQTARKINKFKIYVGDGRFKGFVFEASNDNANWSSLSTGDFPTSISWQEYLFTNEVAFRYYRLRCTSVYTGSNVGVRELELYADTAVTVYDLESIYTLSSLGLSGDLRIRFSTDTPSGTNVRVEHKDLDTWGDVATSEIIQVSPTSEIRVTLTTTDNTITPKLTNLWLEDAQAPQDIILVTLGDLNTSRFHNVEGNLTVSYDQTKGNLQGRGGHVQSFTRAFTPTDLVPKPNPHDAEHLTVSASTSVELIKITYSNAYANENISVSVIASVAFIHVNDINP